MDLLGAGSIYFEVICELPENSNLSGKDLIKNLSGSVSDLEYLRAHCRILYQGLGGSSANTIYALSKLGYAVGFLGTLGKDQPAQEILTSGKGVDLRLLRKYGTSGLSFQIRHQGQTATLKFPNANEYLSFIEDDLGLINSAKYLYLGPIETMTALQSYRQILHFVDEDLYLFYTPGEDCAALGIAELEDLLSRARVVFVTEDELALLTSAEPSAGCSKLLEMGTKVVVCLGKEHLLIASKHSQYQVPFKKTVLKDDSDFLDMCVAGFIAAYLEGADLFTCGTAAVTLSALTSTAYGRDAYPDAKFLKRLIS